jgi:hypothetical protein
MVKIPLSRGLVALVDDEDVQTVLALSPWSAHAGWNGTWYDRAATVAFGDYAKSNEVQ